MDKIKKKKKELVFDKPNSNAPFILRLISLVVDTVLILALSYGIYELFAITPVTNGLRESETQMRIAVDDCKLASGYGEKTMITVDNKDQYSGYIIYKDDSGNEYVVTDVKDVTNEIKEKYLNLVKENTAYNDGNTKYELYSFGVLALVFAISEGIFVLLIPLLNKRRASIGELCCDTLCYNVKRSVKANALNLVGRFLFIYLVETCLPILIVGDLALIFIPLIRLAVIAISKERRALSDYVSHTMLIHKDNYFPVVDEIE